jgi:hypothetical protein
MTSVTVYSNTPTFFYVLAENYDIPNNRVSEILLFTDGVGLPLAGTVHLNPAQSHTSVSVFDGTRERGYALIGTVSTVPVPAAVWLFMSGLGLLGFARKKRV